MKKKLGVFGVGSPFGGDAIAHRVVELLKFNLAESKFKNKVQLEYHDRPGIRLLEHLKHLEVAHLIDAILSDKPIGALHRYDGIKAFQASAPLLSSHELGVAQVLSLGEILDLLPDTIIIHGIEIDGSMSAISDDMSKACNRLAAEITKELAGFF